MTEAWVENDNIVVRDAPKNLMKEIGARVVGGLWVLPATRMYARWLRELGLADDSLVDALEAPGGDEILDSRLYDEQNRAASLLARSRRGAILVMPPGTGKTPVAIVAADASTDRGETIVVVTLPSLMDQWAREIEKWAINDPACGWSELSYCLKERATDTEIAKMLNVRWLIVSWDRVVNDPTLWETKFKKWPLWIVDETVLAKSRTAQRQMVFHGGNVKKGGVITKRYPGLRKSVDRFFLLSASPTTKHSDDLHGSLSIIHPRAFKSYWRTAERYCTIEVTPWARKVTGDKPGMDIVKDNDDLIIVARPEMNLPAYIHMPRQDVELLPAQREAFTQMTDEFVAELSGGRKIIAQNEIGKLIRLQQITSSWDGQSAKAERTVELMQRTKPPYLIWTHWVEGAEVLYDELLLAGFTGYYINAKTKDRDAKIEAYKAREVDALVMSLGVGKFGHTLIVTETEIRVDKTFNGDDYFQSMHRVRRHGLDHRPKLFSLHALDSTDDLIDMNQEGKMKSISKLTQSDLAELLKGIGR